MSEEDYKVKANNTRIAVTAVMSVLLGIVFILALILFGMNVQEKVNERKEQRKKEAEVVTINSVDFETAAFSYSVPVTEGTSENYLVNNVEKDSGNSYIAINSSSKLEDVISAIRSAAKTDVSYSVDSKFFESGSIIAVTREAAGLSDFEVKTVTRDADYNLQIDATEKTEGEKLLGVKEGRVVFVKISNIQPKGIEIKVTKE